LEVRKPKPAAPLRGFFMPDQRKRQCQTAKKVWGRGDKLKNKGKRLILFFFIAPKDIYIFGDKVGTSRGHGKTPSISCGFPRQKPLKPAWGIALRFPVACLVAGRQ
jgi:hypothetical protein